MPFPYQFPVGPFGTPSFGSGFPYKFPVPFGTVGVPSTSSISSYYDRFHFMIEDVHGNILARDVVAQEVSVTKMLSGPCEIDFKINPKEPSIQAADGSGPIQLKPWAQWIHALKRDLNGNEIFWCSGIVQPSDIDPQTGIMSVKAQGFSNYAKGIPWLEDWNPFAVDPFEIVERIWNHMQHGHAAGGVPWTNGDLGVTVYPTTSGTEMLPGFSFDGDNFVQDFFAIFIRASDQNDCGDYINTLARDIPFDFWEEATWAGGVAPIVKKLRLAYPSGGVDQTDLIFRMGENVIGATPKQESEVEWFSDITINGYFPGKVYSSTITNADPDRYRRVLTETDLHIDSDERAAAWAHRKLTRRQFPDQFDSIIIDPYHPNAPFGSFDVGDLIRIQGPMPWVGDVDVKHKILAHIWDETKGQVQLQVMADGAFNYDPIEYVAPGGSP
jgi:hypothetical protein